jgi:spermidine/putrescine transport system permease protein
VREHRPPGPALRLYAVLFYAYLYLPILILMVFSLNESRYGVRWAGFTTHWYRDLLADRYIRQATENTLVVATISTVIATVIGTATALGMHRYRFRGREASEATLYLPVVIPEVVMGIAMLAFFAAVGWQRGLPTVIVGHVAFSVPFVVLTVRARLHGFDRRIEEAAMDLGANEWVTFRRVTLPIIMPGVLAGALLAFTLSLDDYIITLFTSGPGSTTLPLRVYSMIRQAVTPKVNALSTLWILTVFVLLLLVQYVQRRSPSGVRASVARR